MIKEITKESIAEFLNGRDPMERIVNIECGYNDEYVSVIYRDENGVKRIKKDEFRPFVWCKNNIAVRMFLKEGRSTQQAREMLRNEMARRGIGCRGLEIYSNKGKTHERLENGYKIMFYAKRRMSYQTFLQFFQYAGTPIYVKRVTKAMEREGLDGKEFLAVSPVEQYMIQTGKRLFKGYEGYNDLLRMFFDLETEGLNPKHHRISQIGIRTNKGYEKVIPITGEGEERKQNEIKAIDEFFRSIGEEKPDVLAGHNSFNFDHPFIDTRCTEDGTSMTDISKQYLRGGMYIAKNDAVLKLGGEVESYRPTKSFGISIVDSMHSARRAQAQNSDIKSANLKYLTDYINEKKPNRVYVPGDKIQKTWDDLEERYAFNDSNGDWYIYDPNATTNSTTEAPKPGVFKIRTRNQLLEGYELKTGRYIVERYLLDDIYETDKVELKFNEANFLTNKILPTTFERACTMGTAGIWKLIVLAFMFENELAIPCAIKKRRFVGGISRLLRVGYISNVYKLDYNSLYPSIMLTWMIASDADVHGVLLPMLEYVLDTREKFKELKAKAGDRADEIKELLKTCTDDAEKEKLKAEMVLAKAEKVRYDRLQQPMKVLGNSVFGSVSNPELFPLGDVDAGEMTTCTGRQSLRLMIGHFSTLGEKFKKEYGTPYGDEYNYKPIVGDTDGFNFEGPKKFRYTEERPYISTGMGRNTKKDNAYTGVHADIAEFEDLYLRGKMGLGLDDICPATINFSRKNYADLLANGDIKLVGNSIKSKASSALIQEALEKCIRFLLNNDGRSFIETYYEYIEKIYNYRVPLQLIASKGKIKQSLDEYKKACGEFTAGGAKKSRQAWYELCIATGAKVDIGDTIYYINTGTKKSESDVKRITHYYQTRDNEKVDITKELARAWERYKRAYKENPSSYNDGKQLNQNEFSKSKYATEALPGGKIWDEDEIILNCRLLPSNIMDAEDDIFCDDEFEYNVTKYMEQFNNKMRPLTVCLKPGVREKLIVNNPKDRGYFTDEECELCSGMPFNQSDQDTYEELMTMDRREVDFWIKIGKKPPFVDEIGMDWDKIVEENKAIKERENDEIFKALDAQYQSLLGRLKREEKEQFYEDGFLPTPLKDVVHLDTDLKVRFNMIPDMTPSSGGYVFDDIVLDNDDDEDDGQSLE